MSEAASLDGVWAKLWRAREHLDAINAEVDAYFERQPYSTPLQGEHDEGWMVWVLSVGEEAPERLGLILGDYIHNLRSALDHLAVQLVILNGQTSDREVSFPIFGSEAEFEKRGRRRIARMDASKRAAIEGLQPYEGRDQPVHRALRLIADLSNADKHRVINAAFAASRGEAPTPKIEELDGLVIPHSEAIIQFEVTSGPLEDGAEIARLDCLGRRVA